MTADYLTEGVPCCSGCFCNHDAAEIARWDKMFAESNAAAKLLKAEEEERDRAEDEKRVAALREHLARFRR